MPSRPGVTAIHHDVPLFTLPPSRPALLPALRKSQSHTRPPACPGPLHGSQGGSTWRRFACLLVLALCGSLACPPGFGSPAAKPHPPSGASHPPLRTRVSACRAPAAPRLSVFRRARAAHAQCAHRAREPCAPPQPWAQRLRATASQPPAGGGQRARRDGAWPGAGLAPCWRRRFRRAPPRRATAIAPIITPNHPHTPSRSAAARRPPRMPRASPASPPALDDLLALAGRLADEAAAVTLKYFRRARLEVWGWIGGRGARPPC